MPKTPFLWRPTYLDEGPQEIFTSAAYAALVCFRRIAELGARVVVLVFLAFRGVEACWEGLDCFLQLLRTLSHIGILRAATKAT